MKGFKATDRNARCLGFQYEIGKTYKTENMQMCQNGFHFCEHLLDVYNYYEKTENTRIFEVEAIGDIQTEGDKTVTSQIKIIRELSDRELFKAWINRTNSGYRNSGDENSGDENSGYRNSGNENSGNRNSGNENSGDRNSGYRNSGDGNSGYGNSGDGNSGYRNSGDGNSGYGNSGNRNSGYGNSGNRNSGDWNSGDGNSGYFNTAIPVYFFNKPSDLKYTPEFESKIRSLNVKPIVTFVPSERMTEEEKASNPCHKVTGGFLRKTNRMDWTGLTDSDKEFIKSLPNFDDDVFEKISGIRLLPPKTVKIVINGVEKEISFETAQKAGLI